MPFRLEYAKTARGGCSMAACKKADAKIPKGGLKFGTLVDVPSPFSEGPFFVWRHWGCVTEKVLAQANKDLEEDIDELDGFEDLTDTDKDRVTKALATGHIAEEDKTELTEEDQRHYQDYLDDEERIKVMKNEAKEKGEAFDLKDAREGLKRARLATRKLAEDEVKIRERAAKAEAKAEAKAAKEAEKAAKKAEKEAAKAGKKRKQVKDEDDEEDSEEPATKKRGQSKAKVKAEEVEEPAPVRKSARVKKVVKTEVTDDEAEESPEEVKPKTKTARGERAIKEEPEEDDVNLKPKAKTGRGKRAVKVEPDSEDEAPAAEVKANMKAKRGKKQVKTEIEDDEDTADDADGDFKAPAVAVNGNGRASRRTTSRTKSA